jgi:predicted phage terminase large subunit-like protein
MRERTHDLPTQLYRRSLRFFLREVFRQLHPNDPPLVISWYIEAICHALEQTYSGDCRRLVINVPPRHGKSIAAAVAFCAWLLGHDPTLKILVGTYNEDLARLHDRQLRQIMESPQYRAAFPNTIIDRKATRQLELHTTAGGFRMAVTTGGSATGFGGDFIILDDCMKAQDAGSEAERIRVRDWFRGTIGTRLNNKREGVIISIQQRLHEDDLTSYILAAGATHLNLPAIAPSRARIPIGIGQFHVREPGDLLAPEREDRETLDRLRRELGPRVFAPQYLQDPTPAEGNTVRLDWFPRFDVAPERHEFKKVVQSWDTAWSAEPGSAYSVCTTLGYFDSLWYLLDVVRVRLEYYDLKRLVIQMWRRWHPDKVLIENASSGPALWADLRAEGPFRPLMWDVAKSKEERLIAQTGQMEAGKIVLPNEASWLEDYCHELKSAPNCRYWDQVDSTTQFLEFALSRIGWVNAEVDPVTGRKLRIQRKSRIDSR